MKNDKQSGDSRGVECELEVTEDDAIYRRIAGCIGIDSPAYFFRLARRVLDARQNRFTNRAS